MHRYDPSADSWEELADLPVPLSHSVAESIGASIYVMYGVTKFQDKGGDEEQPDDFNFGVFKYDITGGTWEILDTDTSAVLTPISTPLLADAAIGDIQVSVAGSAGFFPNGTGIFDRSGAAEETFAYSSFDATNGRITLAAPLTKAHTAGETIHLTAIPESRVGANALADGTVIKVFNGQSFLGFSGTSESVIRGTISTFDTSTGVFDQTTVESGLPRLRGGDSVLTVSGSDRLYVVGGSADKSDFLDELEFFDVSGGTFTGPGGLDEMLFARHSLGNGMSQEFLVFSKLTVGNIAYVCLAGFVIAATALFAMAFRPEWIKGLVTKIGSRLVRAWSLGRNEYLWRIVKSPD